MYNAGDFPVSALVDIVFNTNAIAGESITIATNGNIRIYKDNGTTERSSSNGITFNEDFDGVTGVHLIHIDTSDNTDAGFYASGHRYSVMHQGATVDGKAVNTWIGQFTIEMGPALRPTTAGRTLNVGSDFIAESNLKQILAGAVPTPNQTGRPLVDLTHINGTAVTSSTDPIDANLVKVNGTTVACTLPTSGVVASQADVRGVADNVNVSVNLPSCLNRPLSSSVAVRFTVQIRSYTGAMASGDSAPTVAVANQSGTSMNSRLQDSGGSATTTMVSTATGEYELYYLVAAADATDNLRFAITVVKNSITKIFDAVAQVVAESNTTSVAAIKAKTDNLPSDPADASDIAASFSTVNSTLATIAGYIDTEVAAIKAKTDNLPGDPADASDIAASFSAVNATLATIAGYIDTEVAAIKAKTDNLPASPAAVGSAMTLATGAIDAANLAAAACNKLADHLRRRSQANVFASANGDAVSINSEYGSIQQMQKANTTDHAGKLTVKNPDGTELAQLTLTSDDTADPITGVA